MGRLKKLEYQVKFLTPAFLGNAEQNGQWRTPPFKALLRQWWRVVWAAENEFREDLPGMRNAEAELFGSANASDRGGQSSKSRVRMRLDRWSDGDLDTNVLVKNHRYLGFGPLSMAKGSNKLQSQRAIRDGDEKTAVLSVCAPANEVEQLRTAISLINAYGTIGGRNRNGWGSIELVPIGDTPPLSHDLSRFLRPWQEALKLEWAHAIGEDEKGPLVWMMSKPTTDWKDSMNQFEEAKKDLLNKFKSKGRSPFKKPQERHWISFPVTNQKVEGWENSRIPNSLRFKVRRDPKAKDPRQLRGVIFHMPCLPPVGNDFRPDSHHDEAIKVWQKAHAHLDKSGEKLKRLKQMQV